MIERVYSVKDVSWMTIQEIEEVIDEEEIEYSADFGLENKGATVLKFSRN